MRQKKSKADYIENLCPTCRGSGSLPQTPEQFREAFQRGFVSAPKCSTCGGSGRMPLTPSNS